MAAIKDLLRQITDSTLRARLTEEIDRLSKNKKFGLVTSPNAHRSTESLCGAVLLLPVRQAR